ncbi:MAG: GNAT family N-acetyltransferase [Firmicutes bacterium]|nr:GNAT family N-acetyltransferase [Bacillota bacterium]
MFHLAEINQTNKAGFVRFVPSRNMPVFERVGEDAAICAVGAFLIDEPIGLAIAQLIKEHEWVISWIYVTPRYRNKGLGLSMTDEIKKMVLQRNGAKIFFTYSIDDNTDNSSGAQIEALLAKACFKKSKSELCYFKTECAEAIKTGWVKRYVCKEALEQRTAKYREYEIFRWGELRDKEKEYLKEIKGQIYPDWFCPLNDEEKNDPSLGLGIRHRDELIGYLVTRRADDDMVHIWRSYLKEQYRTSSIYVTLFATVINLLDKEGIRYFFSDIQESNIRMLKFAIHAFEKKNVPVHRWKEIMAEIKLY